jgi:hypothetical protein
LAYNARSCSYYSATDAVGAVVNVTHTCAG